jgi:N-acetylglucosamine-6-phosphate deacetylase
MVESMETDRMDELLIENVRALQPGEGVVALSVLVRDGKVAALNPEPNSIKAIDRFDGDGRLLTPGLIDIHTHGICGEKYDNPECIVPGSLALGQFGTTTVITTLSGRLAPDLLHRLDQVATATTKATAAHMEMLHLEGPFLYLPGAGGAGVPGDVGLLEEILAACCGQVKAMCISPDQQNIIPVIEKLTEKGIRPFITHTKANVEQTQRAIDAGAHHATHFYDAFSAPDEVDPGVRPVGAVEVLLGDPRCTVDFVCDGVHVHPAAITCAIAAKGYQGVVLITDANSGAGLSPGIYDEGWGKRRIQVCEAGGCRIYDSDSPLHNGLVGSTLTMDKGIGNLRRWLDLPDEQIWAMGTSVPAAVMGLEHKGVMQVGADADLVLWDETDNEPRAIQTWLDGEVVYTA